MGVGPLGEARVGVSEVGVTQRREPVGTFGPRIFLEGRVDGRQFGLRATGHVLDHLRRLDRRHVVQRGHQYRARGVVLILGRAVLGQTPPGRTGEDHTDPGHPADDQQAATAKPLVCLPGSGAGSSASVGPDSSMSLTAST